LRGLGDSLIQKAPEGMRGGLTGLLNAGMGGIGDLRKSFE